MVIMENEIKSLFDKNIELHRAAKEVLSPLVSKAADLIIETYKQGRKVLFCGNGGSAADAQHIAAELVGQFAASVRAIKKPEPYKGKGIRYENEVVRKKQGKKAATAAA